jgi:hypothetical protein
MQARTMPRDFFLGVGVDDDEGIFHPPVGGVGDVRDAGKAVELDVVAAGRPRQPGEYAPAQGQGFLEFGFEGIDRLARCCKQRRNPAVTGVAPGLDAVQAVAHAFDQRRPPLAVAEQVVLDVGVALDDPHVAQHLVEHFRRTPRAPLRAQFVQQVPARGTEKPDDDLAIGERGVVVGDFPQAGSHDGLLLEEGAV